MLQYQASSEAQTKTRVQFDFTTEALQRLDEIKAATAASTRAEVIRDALRLYEWFIDVAEPDSTIKVVDKNGETVSLFQAKLLRSK